MTVSVSNKKITLDHAISLIVTTCSQFYAAGMKNFLEMVQNDPSKAIQFQGAYIVEAQEVNKHMNMIQKCLDYLRNGTMNADMFKMAMIEKRDEMMKYILLWHPPSYASDFSNAVDSRKLLAYRKVCLHLERALSETDTDGTFKRLMPES